MKALFPNEVAIERITGAEFGKLVTIGHNVWIGVNPAKVVKQIDN
jgi:hypothetical protein